MVYFGCTPKESNSTHLQIHPIQVRFDPQMCKSLKNACPKFRATTLIGISLVPTPPTPPFSPP